MNDAYNFVSSTSSSDVRVKMVTAYAQAQGCYKSSISNGSYWWLRSPDAYHSGFARAVTPTGAINTSNYGYTYSNVFSNEDGVVPALQICLE